LAVKAVRGKTITVLWVQISKLFGLLFHMTQLMQKQYKESSCKGKPTVSEY